MQAATTKPKQSKTRESKPNLFLVDHLDSSIDKLCVDDEEIGYCRKASISYTDIAESTGMSMREARSKFNF